MSTLTFSILGKSETATRTNVGARNFNFIVDEPESLGGGDVAPNPVEYLLGGYAGCLNVVINLVARERNIELHNLELDIEGDIDPARFLGFSNDGRAGFNQIRVGLRFDTPATPDQIAALIQEVESRCPINDNLQNPTPVSIKIESKQPQLAN